MADHDPHELADARKVLIEMRHNWAKAIAAGKDTGNAIKALIEVQQAIDVIVRAIVELEDVEELEVVEEEDDD